MVIKQTDYCLLSIDYPINLSLELTLRLSPGGLKNCENQNFNKTFRRKYDKNPYKLRVEKAFLNKKYKIKGEALAGIAQLVRALTQYIKVAGAIPDQGTYKN